MRRSMTTGLALVLGLTFSSALSVAAQDGMTPVDPCTTDPVRVTGEIIWGDFEHDPQVISGDDGTEHIRDFVYGSTLDASDDRLDGATTGAIDWDFAYLDKAAKRQAGVNRGTFRVENAEGTWDGPWTGVGRATDSWRALVELTGAGAYDGLSATLFTSSGDSGPIEGVIYPTDLATCDFTVATG